MCTKDPGRERGTLQERATRQSALGTTLRNFYGKDKLRHPWNDILSAALSKRGSTTTYTNQLYVLTNSDAKSQQQYRKGRFAQNRPKHPRGRGRGRGVPVNTRLRPVYISAGSYLSASMSSSLATESHDSVFPGTEKGQRTSVIHAKNPYTKQAKMSKSSRDCLHGSNFFLSDMNFWPVFYRAGPHRAISALPSQTAKQTRGWRVHPGRKDTRQQEPRRIRRRCRARAVGHPGDYGRRSRQQRDSSNTAERALSSKRFTRSPNNPVRQTS